MTAALAAAAPGSNAGSQLHCGPIQSEFGPPGASDGCLGLRTTALSCILVSLTVLLDAWAKCYALCCRRAYSIVPATQQFDRDSGLVW